MESMSELSFTSGTDTNRGTIQRWIEKILADRCPPSPHPLISGSGSGTAVLSEDNPIFLEDNTKYNT